MKIRSIKTVLLFALTVLATAPALAAQDCGTFVVMGAMCARTVYFGWGTAGQGTASVIDFYVPPSANNPVQFQISQLNFSAGSSYAAPFFGVSLSVNGGVPGVIASTDLPVRTFLPGQGGYDVVSETCFDPDCATPAPPGLVSNMFSMQILILASSGADLAKVPLPTLTVQFRNNGVLTFEEQEAAVEAGQIFADYTVSMNEGATPATRYVFTGSAVNLPYNSFSVTNPSSVQVIQGTVTVMDLNGNLVTTVPIPPIPPSGAAGYLLVGSTGGDPLGLLPSNIFLPVGADGAFHGAVSAHFTGPAIFLAQEFNGNTMLNLIVRH